MPVQDTEKDGLLLHSWISIIQGLMKTRNSTLYANEVERDKLFEVYAGEDEDDPKEEAAWTRELLNEDHSWD